METPIANPSDYGFNRDPMPLYLFQFGAYGSVKVYAWGCHSLEDALEAAAEWCEEHAPGVFTEPDYNDAAAELEAPDDWRDDEEWSDKVAEHAETDLTYTESGYLASWEWYVNEITDTDEVAAVRARSRAEIGEDGD